MRQAGTVRGLRVHARGDLRLDLLPVPVPAPAEAVVRVRYGGICGSDVHYWRDGAVGTSVLQDPMILGHEIVGIVDTPAADRPGPAAGQPVAVHPAATCGTCRWCTSGRANLCPRCRYLGSAAHRPHTNGGFTDLLAVPTARLVPVPQGLPPRRASLAEPAGVAWHAVNRAGAQLAGAEVTVIGGGPIGLLIAAVARYQGAATVTVVDVHDHPLRVAEAIGADRVLTAGQLDESGAAPESDVVFESSGSVAGLATAIRSARRGGTVVLVGQLPADVAVPLGLAVPRELTITGVLRLGSELAAALGFLADPRAIVDPIISDVFPVGQALQAFAQAADPARSSKVLLDFSA